jgi:MoaA/NifB/PqqE/SkfB family radical SAM enzyme
VSIGVPEYELTPTVGEALLDKNIIQQVEYTCNQNINKAVLFTNLSRGVDVKLALELLSISNFHLIVSVYAGNREEYKNVTGVDCFDVFCDNMASLLYSAKKRGVGGKIEWNMRFVPSNSDDSKMKVMLRMIDMYDMNVCKTYDNLNSRESVQKARHDGTVLVPKKIENKHACRFALEDNCVDLSGDITLCGWFDIDKKNVIGNIFTEDIKIIYADDGMFANILKDQRRGYFQGLCKYCDIHIFDKEYYKL